MSGHRPRMNLVFWNHSRVPSIRPCQDWQFIEKSMTRGRVVPNWFVSSWGSHLWDKPRIGHLPSRSTYLCGSKWDDLEAGAAFFFGWDWWVQMPRISRRSESRDRVGAGRSGGVDQPTSSDRRGMVLEQIRHSARCLDMFLRIFEVPSGNFT